MPAPEPVAPAAIDVRQARCHRLSNGVALYTLHSDDFEVLRVSFIFRAGSAVQSHPFTASATANLLAEGTESMSAREVAETLDYYGSWFDVNLDRDYAYINFATLSRFAAPTLRVAEQILLHPTFPAEEIATYAAKRRQKLEIERRKVDVKAREAFARAMFGAEHPYGESYPAEAYDTLTRENILAFYRRFYTAENCFVVCSGRIGDEEMMAITALAEQLPHGEAAWSVAMPEPQSTHRTDIRHEGALQSSIRIGRLLFGREHPDFVGMQVVATTLGGYFGSRLMQNLREEHGYTYGVMAAMVNFEQTGYFAIATQVGADVTQEALAACYEEIERLRREQISDEELELVRKMMIGEMMRILDGPFGIADVTIENILCGTDNSAIDRNLNRILSITPEEIQRLAREYLAEEDLVTVVAGATE